MSNGPSGFIQVEFLRELIDANATVAGDVIRIGVHTWAIHASISVDGSVLVAEYDSLEEANEVLGRLGPNSDVGSEVAPAIRS
jgi:hypothetical protein